MAVTFLLLSKHPVYVIIVSASLIVILTCAVVVVVTWRIAWILWHHNITARTSPATATASAAATFQSSLVPNRGLDKRTLRSLPRAEYNAKVNRKLTECAICLMEFVDGEVIRLLPHCGHGFHVKCIDRWLKCHSSCPSCRDVLVTGRYHNCAAY